MKRKKINIKKPFFGFNITGFVVVFLIFIFSCSEDKIGQNPTDNTPPPPVTNVRTEPIPGGANIFYDIPNEADISYVTCEYLFQGKKKISRASIYNDFVTVEGLPDISPCEYTLYLVDHNENKSAPYVSSFIPLEPPYQTIFKTLEMEPDFGGVVIRWRNEGNVMIGAFLLAMGDDGEWEEYDLAFSTLKEDKRSIRGYNTDPRFFAVCLMDKFGNYTDTLKLEQVPLYEKELDKKLFKDGHLAGDNTTSHTSRPISNIWDGNISVIWHTVPDAGFTPPQTFTIDLGVEAQLSRIMLWNRQDGFTFAQHNVHYFEVWGTKELKYPINDVNYSTGPWRDDWILLGDFEQIKPSGLPLGQSNDEDLAATAAGSEFIFESGAGNIRYIRFVVKETWARTAALHIAEVSVFGDDGVRNGE
ncbi:DUF5000 domain-containing lipoprotein [uncultured Proteiniphilum sp.]|uniref:DUF5000 domain-containing lipoprotein n=1 Tax=uncultured Proteiniphilum sp. TaxID=497637 RepID=UPI002606BAC1|nr:DUF5000 domain-containing lipoprotein [uncultured Proteiniphilum sp.]